MIYYWWISNKLFHVHCRWETKLLNIQCWRESAVHRMRLDDQPCMSCHLCLLQGDDFFILSATKFSALIHCYQWSASHYGWTQAGGIYWRQIMSMLRKHSEHRIRSASWPLDHQWSSDHRRDVSAWSSRVWVLPPSANVPFDSPLLATIFMKIMHTAVPLMK